MIILKATQETLINAVQSVSGIVEKRHTQPILANLFIKKEGNNIDLLASDMEIQIQAKTQFDGEVLKQFFLVSRPGLLTKFGQNIFLTNTQWCQNDLKTFVLSKQINSFDKKTKKMSILP